MVLVRQEKGGFTISKALGRFIVATWITGLLYFSIEHFVGLKNETGDHVMIFLLCCSFGALWVFISMKLCKILGMVGTKAAEKLIVHIPDNTTNRKIGGSNQGPIKSIEVLVAMWHECDECKTELMHGDGDCSYEDLTPEERSDMFRIERSEEKCPHCGCATSIRTAFIHMNE